MHAANVALVILAEVASAFIGGFFAGLVGAALHLFVIGAVLGILSMILSAHLIGRWIGRRERAPNERELTVGSIVYVVICVLMVLTRPLGIIAALAGGGCIAIVLARAALRAKPASARMATSK